MLPENRLPTHPGEVLVEEFLKPLGMTQVDLATHLKTSIQRINEVAVGKRGVTPDLAWLLSMAFGTTPDFWMNLQSAYDLSKHKPEREIKAIRRPKKLVSA